MPRIGEFLIAEGQLTRDGLEEALDWQVLYGGRIGTNLLELQLTEEADLAHALGKQLGAEVAFGDLQVDPAVLGLVPAHVAARQEIVPWVLDKRRLKVLCVEIKVEDFDRLSYKIGRTCVPVIAPEFRVFQLLRVHYGAMRQMRALDFGVVPQEGRAERRRKKSEEQGPPPPSGPELIDESAFNDIYQQMMAGRAAQSDQPMPAAKMPAMSWTHGISTRAAPPILARVQEPEVLEELPDDAILGEATPWPARDAGADEAPVAPAADAEELTTPAVAESWPQEPTPPPPVETPLDFKQALQALSGVTDRDEIAHIVLRASRSKAARALLLQVQGGVALGWDGLGEGMQDGAARRVAMALADESAFSLVVKTRSHFIGPLQRTESNIRFLATLGKKVPKSSAIFPILHRGRVSHMLYLDNGHKEQAPTDVGEMLILSQRISQRVEQLVRER
ncbi:MAG TPA: hypothetical protein VGH20_14525 [Myxococcales bacterium]|jgi:hypothetical protein